MTFVYFLLPDAISIFEIRNWKFSSWCLTSAWARWSNRFVNRFVKILYIKDWRAYIAEFLGTLAFVLISCGVVLSDIFFGDIGRVGIGLTIGFSYAALVFITAHLSGGYLNPVITLALWFSQKLTGVKAIFFILIQLLASLAAAGILLFIFGQGALELGLGGPILDVDTGLQKAVVLEAIMTAILVLATFGTMIDRGGPVSFGPLVLGLITTGATIFALPISGAAFNPARALGPAIISQTFDNLIVWVIGPSAGALFGFVYEFLFLRKTKK